MPLLHKDNGRGGGGPDDNPPRPCRSIAEFLGLDNMLTEPAGAPRVSRNEYGEWAWETPGSPEVAQTPRALVPPGCFPPRHPRAFASYSESAQPGGGGSSNSGCGVWNNGTDHSIQDLMSSLKNLTLPDCGPGLAASPPPAIPYDTSVEPPWPPEQCQIQLRDQKSRADLSRRSSFCGVVSAGRNGGAALRWTGQLPARSADPPGGFSAKLFLGGLPWDITEGALTHALRHFQPVRVEWPGREAGGPPRGFAYVTLESERRVRALLAACRRERAAWYYRLHSRKMRTKEVQVIPWAVCDSNWVVVRTARLEAARTVFVGALHGMLSAAALAMIMNDLFSGVVYAGIDTDKHKYPIGSGRVTFNNVRSYVRAISAAYIEIHTDKFTKKVQVDPYLEDSMCSVCNLQQGPYFCREPMCFGYFCRSCWSWQHSTEEHKPLMRNSKSAHPALPAGPDAGYNGTPHFPAGPDAGYNGTPHFPAGPDAGYNGTPHFPAGPDAGYNGTPHFPAGPDAGYNGTPHFPAGPDAGYNGTPHFPAGPDAGYNGTPHFPAGPDAGYNGTPHFPAGPDAGYNGTPHFPAGPDAGYNGGYRQPSDGTPSPTSGASGTSGTSGVSGTSGSGTSDAEPSASDERAWPLH